jgi:elongation of very long chain fatty acids protein 6
MNLAVHSVMYAYYAGCEMGFSKALSGISIYITTLQISQMVVGLSINAYAVYLADKGGCGDYLANVVGFFMYLSYFFLFAQFFVARYFRRRDTKAKAAAASKKAQ